MSKADYKIILLINLALSSGTARSSTESVLAQAIRFNKNIVYRVNSDNSKFIAIASNKISIALDQHLSSPVFNGVAGDGNVQVQWMSYEKKLAHLLITKKIAKGLRIAEWDSSSGNAWSYSFKPHSIHFDEGVCEPVDPLIRACQDLRAIRRSTTAADLEASLTTNAPSHPSPIVCEDAKLKQILARAMTLLLTIKNLTRCVNDSGLDKVNFFASLAASAQKGPIRCAVGGQSSSWNSETGVFSIALAESDSPEKVAKKILHELGHSSVLANTLMPHDLEEKAVTNLAECVFGIPVAATPYNDRLAMQMLVPGASSNGAQKQFVKINRSRESRALNRGTANLESAGEPALQPDSGQWTQYAAATEEAEKITSAAGRFMDSVGNTVWNSVIPIAQAEQSQVINPPGTSNTDSATSFDTQNESPQRGPADSSASRLTTIRGTAPTKTKYSDKLPQTRSPQFEDSATDGLSLYRINTGLNISSPNITQPMRPTPPDRSRSENDPGISAPTQKKPTNSEIGRVGRSTTPGLREIALPEQQSDGRAQQLITTTSFTDAVTRIQRQLNATKDPEALLKNTGFQNELRMYSLNILRLNGTKIPNSPAKITIVETVVVSSDGNRKTKFELKKDGT